MGQMRRIRVHGVIGAIAMIATLVLGAPRAVAKGAASTAPPPSLVMSISRGPASGLDGVRAYVNAIKPGTGSFLTDEMAGTMLAQLVGASSLAGFDRASPSYLLFVDDGAGAKGFAYAGKVADDKALAQGAGRAQVTTGKGWAVIGAQNVIDRVGSYALTRLAAQPDVASPTITFYLPNVLARYKDQIAVARASVVTNAAAEGMGDVMVGYFDGLVGAAADCDRAVVSIDAGADLGAIDLALVPRGGTALSKFIATQHPSDFALVEKLPAGGAPMLAAGHLEMGPYRKQILAVVMKIYGAGTPRELMSFFDSMMKASTGDVAMAMSMSPAKGMSMSYLFGVADRKAEDAALTRAFALFDKGITFEAMGMETTIKTSGGKVDHDGVALRAYDTTYDLSKLPEPRRLAMEKVTHGVPIHTQLALFDDLGLVAMGQDSDVLAGQAIDAARGKGTRYQAPADVAALLDASRARKESFIMVMDFGGFAAMAGVPAKFTGAMVMSVGFADRAAHFRIALPSATIRSMANAGAPPPPPPPPAKPRRWSPKP